MQTPIMVLGNQWTDLSGNNNHGTLLNGVSFANNRVKTSNTGTGDRSGVRTGLHYQYWPTINLGQL